MLTSATTAMSVLNKDSKNKAFCCAGGGNVTLLSWRQVRNSLTLITTSCPNSLDFALGIAKTSLRFTK
jgi:hypothetical protein